MQSNFRNWPFSRYATSIGSFSESLLYSAVKWVFENWTWFSINIWYILEIILITWLALLWAKNVQRGNIQVNQEGILLPCVKQPNFKIIHIQIMKNGLFFISEECLLVFIHNLIIQKLKNKSELTMNGRNLWKCQVQRQWRCYLRFKKFFDSQNQFISTAKSITVENVKILFSVFFF